MVVLMRPTLTSNDSMAKLVANAEELDILSFKALVALGELTIASTYRSRKQVGFEFFQGLVKASEVSLKMSERRSYCISERVRGSPSALLMGTTLRGVGLCLLDDIRVGR